MGYNELERDLKFVKQMMEIASRYKNVPPGGYLVAGILGGLGALLTWVLIGPEKLAGQTALAEIPIEQGRVILFGFRVQSRAQTFGTFKLLFNAIYTSRTKPIVTLDVITK